METEPQIGARLGARVSLRKLVNRKTGKRTHAVYLWRASFMEGGKRRTKGFKTLKAAEAFKAEREAENQQFGTDETLTAVERSAVLESRKELAELGLTLREAIGHAIDYRRKAVQSSTVSELVAEVIASKKGRGRSTRHVRDIKQKLGRLDDAFGSRPVSTLEAKELDAWLDGLALAPSSVNSYRRVLNLAFSFGRKRGYLETNPIEGVEPATVIPKPTETLTNEQAESLLSGAAPEIVPSIALSFFAGLRTSEITGTDDYVGIDWESIDLEDRTISVRADRTKGRNKRIVPISDNLAEWLRPHARKTGSVFPKGGDRMMKQARRSAGFGKKGSETEKEKAAGVKLKPWPRNAGRHSFASNHLAKYMDAGILVTIMGHQDDAATLHNHYIGVTKPKAAEAYWSISPATADNILRMEAAI